MPEVIPAAPPVATWSHVDFAWEAATRLVTCLDEAGGAVDDNWAGRVAIPGDDEWEGATRAEFLVGRQLEVDRRNDLAAACDEQRELVEQAIARAQAEQDRREQTWQAWQTWWNAYRPPNVAYLTPTGDPPPT